MSSKKLAIIEVPFSDYKVPFNERYLEKREENNLIGMKEFQEKNERIKKNLLEMQSAKVEKNKKQSASIQLEEYIVVTKNEEENIKKNTHVKIPKNQKNKGKK